MRYSVLTPVERRRRRRRGVRPLALLVLAAALGAAVWVTTTRVRSHDAPAAPAPRKTAPPVTAAATPKTEPKVAPVLLTTPTAPRHGFPSLTSAAAILVDGSSGEVLWEKSPHQRRAIASTTKIMTGMLALERLSPDQIVTVAPGVSRTPLVREGLRTGEKVKAWKLLDGLLIFSGNDDALALAEAAAGSRRAFLKLMNQRAQELGLHDTHFSSVSGVIDEGNYSSAWDLAALTRQAMADPRFRRIVSTRIARVPWSAPTFGKVYVNKNDLLRSYRGADGVKTGWTTIAGHCLVASARRDGVHLIAVFLHATDPYRDARRLFNYGFGLSR